MPGATVPSSTPTVICTRLLLRKYSLWFLFSKTRLPQLSRTLFLERDKRNSHCWKLNATHKIWKFIFKHVDTIAQHTFVLCYIVGYSCDIWNETNYFLLLLHYSLAHLSHLFIICCYFRLPQCESITTFTFPKDTYIFELWKHLVGNFLYICFPKQNVKILSIDYSLKSIKIYNCLFSLRFVIPCFSSVIQLIVYMCEIKEKTCIASIQFKTYMEEEKTPGRVLVCWILRKRRRDRRRMPCLKLV